MASNYKEINFEEHIEAHLLNSGYRRRVTEEYDKSLCLIPDEVIQFIQVTQPKAFDQLGSNTEPKPLKNSSSALRVKSASMACWMSCAKGSQIEARSSSWHISSPPAA